MLCKLNATCGIFFTIHLILVNSVFHAGGGTLHNSKRDKTNFVNTIFNTKSMSDEHHVAKRMDLDLESCLAQFDVHKNTIIRTGESQAIGGKYLQGLELSNSLECQRLCCETETCDVFIFEDKNEGYCYLFKCGPPENFHCKFTRHANYTSAVLTSARQVAVITTPRPRLPQSGVTNVSQQEWELTNLKVKPEIRDEKEYVIPTATAAVNAAAAPMLQTLATENYLTQPRVPPTQNYSAHCGRFQFMCHSGECIAIYNACDGIPQCEDSSDEGPECSRTSSNSMAEKPDIKPVTVVPQYQLPFLQQSSQQQLQSLQQNHLQPSLSVINNREDAAAWANRKMQIQAENTGNLEQPSNTMQHNTKLKTNMAQTPDYLTTLQRGDTVYVPLTQGIPQEEPQNRITGNWQQQQQTQQVVTKSPHLVELQPRLVYIPNAQQQKQQPQITPATTSTLNEIIPSQTTNKNAKENRSATNAEQKLETGPQDKSLLKETNEKSIDKTENNEAKHKDRPKSTEAEKYQEPHVVPVHEQYKVIHANLAMEFHSHDHDGYSERPSGAVLSLTLGLLITAALAILIGCRMRTVGKPMRRLGKAQYSHDADFLVNGMYL